MRYNCPTYNVETSNDREELLQIIIQYNKEMKKYVPSVTYEHDQITRQLRKTVTINQQKLVAMGMDIEEILNRTGGV